MEADEQLNVSDISSSFDPLQWAEKRKLAMAKASELRDRRRARAESAKNSPRVVRAESRDSVSTQGGGATGSNNETGWKWSSESVRKPEQVRSITHPPPSGRIRNPLSKPPVPRPATRRAVTSPAEKRTAANPPRPLNRPVSARKPVPPVSRPIVRPRTTQTRPPPPSARTLGNENVPNNNDNDPVTRQMIDRDTLRRDNREMFIKAINHWRSKNLKQQHGSVSSSSSGNSVGVYVRKRPIFEKETILREFDIVTVTDPHSLVTHNCLFQADLKTPYLLHNRFRFTRCFGEDSSNDEVYRQTARELVILAMNGGTSTLFCFGQTGSGKTHTMTAIEHLAASDIFTGQPEEFFVELRFVELCSKRVLDLLSDNKDPIKLRETGSDGGGLVLDGATTVQAKSAETLSRLMETAHERRNTESTSANDVSSRSHAVCIIHIGKGKLMLVDLAGSERRKDSMWHDKERQREGAEINASLHALKECIRWRANGGGPPPFRLSTLTRILAETFSKPEARLGVIATVSPCATDVEHTVSTLKSVGLLTGRNQVTETKQTEMYPKEVLSRSIHPKKWTSEQVQDWFSKEGEKELPGLPKSTNGSMLVRMPESRFIQLCGGSDKRGMKLYRNLHDLMNSS
jgi:kinesin family protein 2/24